jgi:hypothetical protein
MQETQNFDDKNDRNSKRLRSYQGTFLIVAGIGVIIVAMVAPLFYWYVIMHATCAPSDDLCGMNTGMVLLLFSLPCVLIGLVMLLVGLFRQPSRMRK